MKNFRLFLLLGICLVFGGVKLVMAQNNGVMMSPPFADVEIAKGDLEKDLVIELTNQSQTTITLNLSVVDFGSLDESGGVAFLTGNSQPGDRKYALASWMSLEKDWVVIDPGKKETVKVAILNKESLSGGGHYGAVLATLKTEEKPKADMVGFNQALATLVYVQKSGGEIKSLIYKSVDYVTNWLKLPSQMKIRFENNGNTHLTPRGKVEINDAWGNIVSKGIINDSSGRIIPESFRLFSVSLKQNQGWLWPGKYQIKIDFRYDGKEDFQSVKIEYKYVGKEGIILLAVVIILGAVWWWYKRRV